MFHAADAFAMPSLFEPFGNVVMEAMASGLPAMTSAFSGVAEIIPPSMRGFRVDNPDDVGESRYALAPCSTRPQVSPPKRERRRNNSHGSATRKN